MYHIPHEGCHYHHRNLTPQPSLRRNLKFPLRISAIKRSTRQTSLSADFKTDFLLLRLFVTVLCAIRCSCFWRCSFSCARKHHTTLLLTHFKYSWTHCVWDGEQLYVSGKVKCTSTETGNGNMHG